MTRHVGAKRAACWPRILLAILLLEVACSIAPRGPPLPIPTQDVDAPVPPGNARVVFFNTSDPVMSFLTGRVSIHVDGRPVPGVHVGEYVQVFLEAGEHEFVLQYWDIWWHTQRVRLVLTEECYLALTAGPGRPLDQRLDARPGGFQLLYASPDSVAEWPAAGVDDRPGS